MTNHGLSTNDLVEATGLSYQKINSYINGTIPKNADLIIICEAIGVDVDDVSFDNLNMSVTEAAKTLQKSGNYIKAMVENGVFGSCVGSNYHIPRLQVEKYLGLKDSPDFKEFISILSYAIKDIVEVTVEQYLETKKVDSAKSTNIKSN
ncbi:MAG: XRE family transcriptional regulator [Coprobacillus sp.]